jgi:hypothetical protein
MKKLVFSAEILTPIEAPKNPTLAKDFYRWAKKHHSRRGKQPATLVRGGIRYALDTGWKQSTFGPVQV